MTAESTSAGTSPAPSNTVSGPPPPGPIRRLPAWIKGPVILAVGFAILYAGLRWAYGGFGNYYYVSLDVPRAGSQLQVGSDVRMHGVVVGKVSSVDLVRRHVRLRLQIEEQYRIPSDSQAFITLTTLLGAKFVDLRAPSFSGPFLADGSRLATGHVGPELEDFLSDGVRVFDAINPDDLATIVHELSIAAQGHGKDVARGLRYGSQLNRLFARTLDPQLEALDDFTRVFGALRGSGVELNDLADALNEGVPVYASAEAQRDLDAALRAVVPFADNLADLLILNRADWDRLISAGDKVLGTIADRPEDLRSLVSGLYTYVKTLGGDPNYLFDGSAEAGFTNFIGGTSADETRAQICGALPPDVAAVVPMCAGGTP